MTAAVLDRRTAGAPGAAGIPEAPGAPGAPASNGARAGAQGLHAHQDPLLAAPVPDHPHVEHADLDPRARQ
ncbi:hypothetical protein [uncultured Actinomyces sp.]|uniref:hypothetical protein n=1 Tax=uncultured Actinomyces sp. TaxID=249061 RepID=UPI00288BED9D|nr:hypothetical protein [uncultured Actinomyces sp.]